MATRERTAGDLAETIADRMAVADVVLRYFALVDAKDWDSFDEVLTDDTTAHWTTGATVQGRGNLVDAMRHMIGSDEIVTFHHVAAMAPEVAGDTAEVTARVRAMHYGVGRREGKFYESFGIQPTRLVRVQEGWRISHHDWEIALKLGDLQELFAPELAAGKKH
jgi:ketosteroid isomerase-like protein